MGGRSGGFLEFLFLLIRVSSFSRFGPLRFTGTPGNHGVPCMAVRVDNDETGASVCYSSDTRPSAAIAQLADRVRHPRP